jgi:type IV pilus assembly protein PilQ
MRMRHGSIVCTAVALISLFLLCSGCAQRMSSVKEDSLTSESRHASLTSIIVNGDASAVEISADRPLIYTFYKTTAPPTAVIDLAQTDPGELKNPILVDKGSIKSISVARHIAGESVLSRIEIVLANDEDISVTTDPVDKGKLLVAFMNRTVESKDKVTEGKQEEKLPKMDAPVSSASTIAGAGADKNDSKLSDKESRKTVAETAVKNDPAPVTQTVTATPVQSLKPVTPEEHADAPLKSEKVLTGIKIVPDGIEITVTGGTPVFSSFKLSSPLRVVLDVAGVKNGVDAKAVTIDKFTIGKARLGSSPGKVRIVLDVTGGKFPPYTISAHGNGIHVRLAGIRPSQGEQAVVAVGVKHVEPSGGAVAPKAAAPSAIPLHPSVEAIDFRSVGEYDQIAIKVSGGCISEKPGKSPAGMMLKIKNCQIPRNLQRMIDTTGFSGPVREITPYQVKISGGYEARLLVKVTSAAPYNYRQEGDTIYWEFKRPAAAKAPLPVTPPVPAASAPVLVMAHTEKSALHSTMEPAVDKKATASTLQEKHHYTGRKVTLEFSDADIRKIFQLIADVSNLNLLIADDVTGTISLKLVNVPWDQALDVILESKNLDMKREGNIIQIKPRGKFKTEEQEEDLLRIEREKRMTLYTRVFDVNFAALGDVVKQFEGLKSRHPDAHIISDARTNKIIVNDNEKRLKDMADLLAKIDQPEKQVMIEARIVEASSNFSRDLGIQWGIHYRDASASIMGINQLDTGFGGVVNSAPTSGTSGPGGAIGMSFGTLTSNIQLDLRLSAAAVADQVKIISTPKVVTLNNKMAKISQGQNIPYQTSSSNSGPVTAFIEATLSLEVTPHITADGNIGMQIKATNNSIGAVPQGATAPSINMKQASTEMQVQNGQTTVIGGIYVDNDTESETGVPYLKDIPLFGWLFKSHNKTKGKTELLIFITPRIVS